MLQENAHIPLINEWLAPGQDDRQVLIAEVMIETFYPFVHSSWLAFTRQITQRRQPMRIALALQNGPDDRLSAHSADVA
jgi:hypothetical protein